MDKVSGIYPINALINFNKRINRVGFNYYKHRLVAAIGHGGIENIYKFKEGEYIASMTVCKDKKNIVITYRIIYISLKTNLNKEISWGNYNNNKMTFEALDGYAISRFIGFAWDEINRIGCIYQKLKS